MNLNKKYTFPLFESIRIQNREIKNRELHLERVVSSRISMWNTDFAEDFINLFGELSKEIICTLDYNLVYKLKVMYNQTNCSAAIEQYTERHIDSFRLVEGDSLEYSLKYTDRSGIENLRMLADAREKLTENEDIIIVKNGKITDSSFANLVFERKGECFTPKECVLKGTKREQYIRSGLIAQISIKPGDIDSFDSCRIINAMRDLY